MTSSPIAAPTLAQAVVSLAWWLGLLGLASFPGAAAVNQEAAALLTIRGGFTNGEAVLPDWTNASSAPCSWKGVECDPTTGHVITVALEGQGLQGTITTEGWMQLEGLQGFSLANNRLNGTLSKDWLLPDTVRVFNVSLNELEGTLPPDYRFPSSLVYLCLRNNFFNGTIPTWELPENVTELDISSNQLSGPYPRGWVLPPALRVLNLHTNRLTGTLDPVWQLPSTLQVLSLKNNRFRSTIPSNWTLPDSLQTLDLYFATLTGIIPADFTLPSSLLWLSLSLNKLTGSISKDWKLPSTLQELYLDNNQLTGTLDPAWDFPATLTNLSLFDNQFRGTIPNNWTLPDSLQRLYLYSNPLLTGTIPQDWVLPPALAEFVLSDCNFSGPLPSRLKLPSGLQSLGLGGNSLTGTIPADWELPDSLQTLELSGNSLTGTIPANFTLPSSLLELSLSSNQLTGTISKDWKLPSALRWVYLDDNQLTGTLDPAWEFPEALSQFLLVYNNFSGLLPAWNLPNLYQADFRFCNFSGPLPAYPTPPNATVIVLPQSGDGFCGEIPSSPPYFKVDPGIFRDHEKVHNNSFDNCPPGTPPRYTYPPATANGGSCSTVGIAVGVAVGVAASVAVVLGAWWWMRRRRRRGRHASSLQKNSPFKSSLGDDLDSSAGQRHSLGKDGFDAKVVVDEMSSSAMEATVLHTASGTTEAAQQDPVLAVALKTEVSDDSAAEPAASQRRMSRQSLELSALRMWTINFKALELQRQIGEGSFGRVYIATWQRTLVAVKILLNTALDVYSEEAVKQALTLSNPVLKNLQKEAALMCSLRHPSIVTFLGVCTVPPCVVTEYCARGSLADVLRNARQSSSAAAKLDWPRRLNMMLDTAKGMMHLHSHSPPIIHRDLKSPNLLVDTHWRCKISDFNLSRILEDRVVLSSAMATNPRWLAPEVLEGQPATLQSDVYSFGIVLWEVLTWNVPFANENHFQLIKHVRAGGRPPVPSRQELPGREDGELGGLDDYVALMKRCWAQAPEDRPSFQRVVGTVRDMLTKATSGRRPAAKAHGEAVRQDEERLRQCGAEDTC